MFDLDDPFYWPLMRVVWTTTVVMSSGVAALIYWRVERQGDRSRTVKVSTPTGLGPMDQEDEVISHYEYDHRELSKIVMQILIGSCIVGYMHFSCEYFVPLVIQSVQLPVSMYSSGIVKIYVMPGSAKNEDLQRPFKDVMNPFADIMEANRRQAELDLLKQKARKSRQDKKEKKALKLAKKD